jgi:hypothetical protein
MFKSKIEAGTYKGVAEHNEIWYNTMKKKGLF